jgi:hypothetical protein
MGLLKLTESERLEILNLHNNARIIKEQASSVVSSAAPAAAPTDDKSKIMAIQKLLKTKYNADLGTAGEAKDGVDGVLGQKTITALSTAMKSKSKAAPAAGTTPVAGTGTQLPTVTVTGQKAPDPAIAAAPNVPLPSVATPAAPGVSGQPAPATPATAPATQGADEFGTEAPQPQLSAQSQQALAGQLTPQQIRQQGRFDQRLARQARRNTRRAGQQEQ